MSTKVSGLCVLVLRRKKSITYSWEQTYQKDSFQQCHSEGNGSPHLDRLGLGVPPFSSHRCQQHATTQFTTDAFVHKCNRFPALPPLTEPDEEEGKAVCQ